MVAVIESARGPFATFKKLPGVPASKNVLVQPETGTMIRRVTDAAALERLYGGAPWNLMINTTTIMRGITNGYSRFTCISPSGNNILAFGTTPYAILFDKALNPIHPITSPANGGYKIGDYHELKWNPADGLMYYVLKNTVYKQTVDGKESVVCVLPAELHSTSDGSFDAKGRLVAYALQNDTTVIVDVLAGLVVQTIAYKSPNGVDITPTGKYCKIDQYYYSISTGLLTGSTQPGHGAFCIAPDGRECFVSQHKTAGWVAAYFPDTGEIQWLMRLPGEDATGPFEDGILECHMSVDKGGISKGWCLVTFAGGVHPLSDNAFMLQIVNSKKYGTKHPSYDKTWTSSMFHDADVPDAQAPKIRRVCHMQSAYIAGEYFTESFWSLNPDKMIYGGCNFNGTHNLELVRAEVHN